MEKECIVCGKIIVKPVNESVKAFINRHKYCSKECSYIPKKDTSHLKDYQFKKGEHRGVNTEFKNGNIPKCYKGNDASYSAKHHWIEKQLGKAIECKICQTDKAKRYEWHSISHNHLRDLKDWLSVCVTCHKNIHLNKIILN